MSEKDIRKLVSHKEDQMFNSGVKRTDLPKETSVKEIDTSVNHESIIHEIKKYFHEIMEAVERYKGDPNGECFPLKVISELKKKIDAIYLALLKLPKPEDLSERDIYKTDDILHIKVVLENHLNELDNIEKNPSEYIKRTIFNTDHIKDLFAGRESTYSAEEIKAVQLGLFKQELPYLSLILEIASFYDNPVLFFSKANDRIDSLHQNEGDRVRYREGNTKTYAKYLYAQIYSSYERKKESVRNSERMAKNFVLEQESLINSFFDMTKVDSYDRHW